MDRRACNIIADIHNPAILGISMRNPKVRITVSRKTITTGNDPALAILIFCNTE
jgi:hypothetical protein